jgi:shikimate kinase
MKIFLVGYMASGKSGVGRQLAGLLHLPFLDTDELIAGREGRSVPEIFAMSGERYFRKAEQEVLDHILVGPDAVVATGGGLPCHGDNMKRMIAGGTTVYLEASAGLLFHRLLRSREGRPLLEDLDDIRLMEKIQSHLADRHPVYATARLTVPAASTDVKALADRIRKIS